MSTFKDFELTSEQEKKGRKILRIFASNDYFGDISTLLIRIVAENIDTVDLVLEAEKMFQWSKEKKKKPSMLRFNSWVRRSKNFQRGDEINVKDIVDKEIEKVRQFKKQRADDKNKKKVV